MTAVNQNTPPVLTVSQLTQAIKLCLESAFPHISLQGEVSNCKLQSSGHLYFSLKDAQSQISAVMFRGDVSRLKKIPKDGDQVIVRGDVNVYPPSGKYQVVVRDLRLAGLGELLLKLEELKVKLYKRGWFKSEHKKPLPKFPKTIGVVTSPTGAAIQDMLNILTRRFAGFHLILNPVKVQGEGAAEEIAQAIRQFNEYDLVDVMIVGRGGGSIEDLWAFNEEIVAEAIFNSRIPVVAAVGHESDHCIAEYVADLRAPTPSAAAEIVSAETALQMENLAKLHRQLQHTVMHLIRQSRQRLNGTLKQPIFLSPYPLLGTWIQKIDDTRAMLDREMLQILKQKRMLLDARTKHVHSLKPMAQILHFQQKLVYFTTALTTTMQRQLALHKERLEKTAEALHTVNPKNLLTKGYSILFSEKERSVITSVSQLKKGQEIRTLLPDGEVLSTVKDTFEHE